MYLNNGNNATLIYVVYLITIRYLSYQNELRGSEICQKSKSLYVVNFQKKIKNKEKKALKGFL
jgi:hypothetical protein